MRILQVIPHYIPAYRYGGPQRVAHSLGRAIVRCGHEVVVCTTNLQDETRDLDVPLDQPVDVDGLSVYYEPTRYLRYWGFSPALYRRTKQEILCADIIVVHAHYQFANWAGARLARRMRKPYVVFSHGSLNKYGVIRKNAVLKRLYLRLVEHNNLRQSLFIAFNSREEKNNSFYSSWGKFIPSGIDSAEFANTPPKGYLLSFYPQLRDKITFLFLGRLNYEQKGLDMLIPAFGRLVELNPDVRLLIAGSDERGGQQEVRQAVNACKVSEQVIFAGMLEGELKIAALQEADVFVLPSPSEGTSIALLESLYFGLPVLVTDRVGLCETIRQLQAGIVVPPSVKDIYRGLLQLSDDTSRSAMRNQATELVREQYTWDAIAAKFLTELKINNAA